MKKYVLDTNVLISDPSSIFNFDDNQVIIPFPALEELDHIKSKGLDVSRDARLAIRNISEVIGESTYEELTKGIDLSAIRKTVIKGGTLTVIEYKGEVVFDLQHQDDKIIAIALQEGAILVTRDINMRLKALSKGCVVEDYRSDTSIKDADLIHVGHSKVQNDFWDTLSHVEYDKETAKIPVSEFPEDCKLYKNDYLYNDDGIVGKVLNVHAGTVYLKPISEKKLMNKKLWDITPNDIYQGMVMDAITDENIDISILLGPAGTGKTFITMASALELIVEKRLYKRMIFTRSMDSQFEEIGFLPGTEYEKMAPWVGGAFDSLEQLHKKDAKGAEESIKFLMEKGYIMFKALNFIRGRSFNDTILVIDECQNLTAAQMKTILTRAGENCKVILMGNLAQIDNRFVTPTNSGLTYVAEKFKDWEGSSVIQLENIVRSRLAEFAEKTL